MKLFIDTDPGCDDIFAIIYILKHSTHEVVAMSSVAGNVDIDCTTRNLRLLTAYFNRDYQHKIKIYKGASKPMIHVAKGDATFFHGEDGSCNFFYSDYYNTHKNDIELLINNVKLSKLSAVMGLIKMSKKYKGELTIVALGPLTNIALAQIIDPEFESRIKEIMIMGGEIYGFGNSEYHPASEYNFNKDPEAAYVVFKQIKCKTTILPLEPNFSLSFTQEMSQRWAETLKNREDLLTVIMLTIIKFHCKRNKIYRLYDLMLAMIIVDPTVVNEIMKVNVSVELHGQYTRGKLIVKKNNDSDIEAKVNIIKSLNRESILLKMEKIFQ